MRFRRANPVYGRMDYAGYTDTPATYGGVVSKTTLLLAIIAAVAVYFSGNIQILTTVNPFVVLIGSPIIAIISIIVVHRSPGLAMPFSIIYAIAEGVFLGFLSLLYAYFYGGAIVQTALVATFGVLFGMLFLYSSGVIRVGPYFRRFLYSMLIGLVISSLLLFIVALTAGITGGFYTLYIGIVFISVIIASLFLLVDFDNITKFVDAGADKQYEWSLSLGLVVTIVWLYVELLRLLAILANRR